MNLTIYLFVVVCTLLLMLSGAIFAYVHVSRNLSQIQDRVFRLELTVLRQENNLSVLRTGNGNWENKNYKDVQSHE